LSVGISTLRRWSGRRFCDSAIFSSTSLAATLSLCGGSWFLGLCFRLGFVATVVLAGRGLQLLLLLLRSRRMPGVRHPIREGLTAVNQNLPQILFSENYYTWHKVSFSVLNFHSGKK
jgi:hypothetical protein